ncbi:MAG TPA: RNA polymerase sigma factor [Cyclobacteriaceae bacterium]|nr:RNA polymerase sigma factor [Cyclobacteriaceae bacterium]
MESFKINDYRTSQLDDNTVVRRVIAGEKELFEILMRRHNQTLYRVIRGYLRDDDEIRDAMQNAYLKAFDKLFQFHGNSAFATWLIRIGINEALMRLKDIKRNKVLYLTADEVGSETLNRIPDKQINAERVIIRQETQQLLEHAVDNLPEKYRVIYMMKEVEGMSNQEIAECLGLTESNVKVRGYRAKAILKDLLLEMSSGGEIFEFGSTRCDAVVDFVMKAV